MNVGILLSGCGVFDGSEVHEVVLTKYFLAQENVEVTHIGLDGDQTDVVNHQDSGEKVSSKRSMLEEAARFSRGPLIDIDALDIKHIDALIIPGGFGVAKSFSTYAQDGQDCTVNPKVSKLIKSCHEAGIPLGFICIAPVLAAKVLDGVHVTVGTDGDTSSHIESFGATHRQCHVTDIIVDEANRLVSTPAYMASEDLSDIGIGIEKLVNRVLKLVKQKELVY